MQEQSELPVKYKPKTTIASLTSAFRQRLKGNRSVVLDAGAYPPEVVQIHEGGYHPDKGLGYDQKMVSYNPGHSYDSIQVTLHYDGTIWVADFDETVAKLTAFNTSRTETEFSTIKLPGDKFYNISTLSSYHPKPPQMILTILPDRHIYYHLQETYNPKFDIGGYYFFHDNENGGRMLDICGASLKGGITEVLKDINKLVDVAKDFTPSKELVDQKISE